MKPLFTEEEYLAALSTEKLPCECYNCSDTFSLMKKEITRIRKVGSGRGKYCGRVCMGKAQKTAVRVKCKECNKKFEKVLNQIKRYPNHFCGSSCAATYNNKNKKYGTRKSKLEDWLETQLSHKYKELSIIFNGKKAIGSELDIYIPELSLAFEINGIFHYEPIFGNKKLNSIKQNDVSKYKACCDNKIDLCIIDSSGQKRFTEKSSYQYLEIIENIINSRLIEGL